MLFYMLFKPPLPPTPLVPAINLHFDVIDASDVTHLFLILPTLRFDDPITFFPQPDQPTTTARHHLRNASDIGSETLSLINPKLCSQLSSSCDLNASDTQSR